MTLSAGSLSLYAAALFVLFLTPGPVWVAIVARTLSGGFAAAVPLALGVVVGDVIWPFLAILGVSWIVDSYGDVMTVLRWVACATFVVMGILILRSADNGLVSNSRLTRPGALAGFMAGLAAILGNPKAILFYMGMLPGFFDLAALTWPDIVTIALVSALVPLAGNLVLALGLGRARRLLASPRAVRRMNRTAGVMMLAVAVLIAVG